MPNQHMEELNDQQIVRREKMAALAEQRNPMCVSDSDTLHL